MANDFQITFQGIKEGLPPIKLDSYVYFVLNGSYSRILDEKLITERYTGDGSIDRQIQNTEKHRWKMTLLVPQAHTQISVSAGAVPDGCTWGDIDNLHSSANKVAPSDLLVYYDITTNWNFATPTAYVYISIGEEAPHENDIGKWQVPIDIWGYDYT